MLTRSILTSAVIASLLALPWEVRGADNKAPGTADADIRLKSEEIERSPIVIGRFAYLDGYRAVYTRENGQVLVARVGEHQESSLVRVGDRVRIRARCGGIKDGAIHFTRCKIVAD